VPEVDDLVKDLVHEHEVLPDHLLADLTEEVLDDDHHSVEQLEHERGGDVEAGGGDDVNG